MAVSAWSSFARERIRLPMRLKGCGLPGAADRRHAQYIGVAVQSTPPLMDRKDKTGCTIPGRLNLPAIVTLFGNDAFDHPYPAPGSAASTTAALRLTLRPEYDLPRAS